MEYPDESDLDLTDDDSDKDREETHKKTQPKPAAPARAPAPSVPSTAPTLTAGSADAGHRHQHHHRRQSKLLKSLQGDSDLDLSSSGSDADSTTSSESVSRRGPPRGSRPTSPAPAQARSRRTSSILSRPGRGQRGGRTHSISIRRPSASRPPPRQVSSSDDSASETDTSSASFKVVSTGAARTTAPATPPHPTQPTQPPASSAASPSSSSSSTGSSSGSTSSASSSSPSLSNSKSGALTAPGGTPASASPATTPTSKGRPPPSSEPSTLVARKPRTPTPKARKRSPARKKAVPPARRSAVQSSKPVPSRNSKAPSRQRSGVPARASGSRAAGAVVGGAKKKKKKKKVLTGTAHTAKANGTRKTPTITVSGAEERPSARGAARRTPSTTPKRPASPKPKSPSGSVTPLDSANRRTPRSPSAGPGWRTPKPQKATRKARASSATAVRGSSSASAAAATVPHIPLQKMFARTAKSSTRKASRKKSHTRPVKANGVSNGAPRQNTLATPSRSPVHTTIHSASQRLRRSARSTRPPAMMKLAASMRVRSAAGGAGGAHRKGWAQTGKTKRSKTVRAAWVLARKAVHRSSKAQTMLKGLPEPFRRLLTVVGTQTKRPGFGKSMGRKTERKDSEAYSELVRSLQTQTQSVQGLVDSRRKDLSQIEEEIAAVQASIVELAAKKNLPPPSFDPRKATTISSAHSSGGDGAPGKGVATSVPAATDDLLAGDVDKLLSSENTSTLKLKDLHLTLLVERENLQRTLSKLQAQTEHLQARASTREAKSSGGYDADDERSHVQRVQAEVDGLRDQVTTIRQKAHDQSDAHAQTMAALHQHHAMLKDKLNFSRKTCRDTRASNERYTVMLRALQTKTHILRERLHKLKASAHGTT